MNCGGGAEINLLWSGGGTVLFVSCIGFLLKRKRAQPFYIIDTARRSALHELRAMHVAREEVAKGILNWQI